MPKITKPIFRAKLATNEGKAAVYFVARFNGHTYKLYPGQRVPASQWSKDRKGKGNGRLKTGINAPASHAAINDRLDAYESKLYEIWDQYNGDLTPDAMRELLKSETSNNYPLSLFIQDCANNPDRATIYRAKLSRQDQQTIDAFINSLSSMRGLRSVAAGKEYEILTLREYMPRFVERLQNKRLTNEYAIIDKHMNAFMEVYGEVDFSEIDWTFFERFVDFAYTEHSFEMQFEGNQINYKKMQWSQGQASKVLGRIKRIVNDARKFGHTGNRLVNERGFNIPPVEGNKAPIFIEDMQLIQGADFSGHPKFANIRLLVERGFFTALRYSDLHKVSEQNVSIVKGNDVLTVWAEKTGRPVAIPLMPVFRPSLKYSVRMPGNNGVFNDHVREMLDFVGINRIIDWTTHKGGERKQQKVNIAEKFSAHDLRRSAATMLVYDLELPDRRVMPITGHSRESSFRKYLCASDAQFSAASLSEEWKRKKEKWLMGVQ